MILLIVNFLLKLTSFDIIDLMKFSLLCTLYTPTSVIMNILAWDLLASLNFIISHENIIFYSFCNWFINRISLCKLRVSFWFPYMLMAGLIYSWLNYNDRYRYRGWNGRLYRVISIRVISILCEKQSGDIIIILFKDCAGVLLTSRISLPKECFLYFFSHICFLD